MPGDLAKLIFVSPEGGERMWVRVDTAEAGRYRGTLDNRPVATAGLSIGDAVEFGPEHVADVEHREE